MTTLKTTASILARLEEVLLDAREADRVYAGRAGCMCGCCGTYTDAVPGNRAKTKRNKINAMKRFAVANPDAELDEETGYVCLSTDRRVHAIYFVGH